MAVAGIDTYTKRARLYPALLAALPLPVTVFGFCAGGDVAGWGTLWGVILWCGGTALLAQMGRDRGRKKQEELFRSWGGKPSTQRLQWQGGENRDAVQRHHKNLVAVVRDACLPSAEEESEDAEAADRAYEVAVSSLIGMTRDGKRFPLVFEENCNYGFRRNLWGLKPIGATAAGIGTLILVVMIGVMVLTGRAVSMLLVLAAICNGLLLLGWLFWFTRGWVRIPAEAYADRLLEAAGQLAGQQDEGGLRTKS